MRRALFTLVVLIGSCAGTWAQSPDGGRRIAPEAVWNPDNSFRQRVMERCSSPEVRDFGRCFVSVMKDSGASPQAVAFARLTGNTAYLRGFREAGVVDIASVEYPFRANENYGCYLVNGVPPVIDVDEYAITSKIDLAKDKGYKEILSGFPGADLWPGDRWSDKCIVAETGKSEQRFLVTYRLLNGCHACELLGLVRVAFDFDGAGRFLGTKLLGIEGGIRVFSDPGKPARVAEGRKFALVVESNPTTGYCWELSFPGKSAIVTFEESEYHAPAQGLIGAGGKETWTFKAVGEGTTEITLNYARPWEKDVPPARTVTFRVRVEKR